MNRTIKDATVKRFWNAPTEVVHPRVLAAPYSFGVSPPQAIAIDEYYAAEDTEVINARLAMALEKAAAGALFAPRKASEIAHRSVSLKSLNHAQNLKSIGPETKFVQMETNPSKLPSIPDRPTLPIWTCCAG